MKQETKEYIDTQLAELAKQLRTEIGDTAQRIHEDLADLSNAARANFEKFGRIDERNARIRELWSDDVDRRLDVLDKLAVIDSRDPALNDRAVAINEEYADVDPNRQPSLFDSLASLTTGIVGG